jgi:exodeoxyribonuclease-5
MVTTQVLSDLQRMSHELILVGDGNQLPPVRDLVNPRGQFNSLTHTATLTQVHRQATGNPALAMATRLREGRIHPLSADVVRGFLPKPGEKLSERIRDLDFNLKSWRVITYTNKTRHAMNRAVRTYYGHAGSLTPQPGELLISMENFDENIVNGSALRVITATFPSDLKVTREHLYGCATVDVLDGDVAPVEIKIRMSEYLRGFPEHEGVRRELARLEETLGDDVRAVNAQFGYAITCHKAQGSEYDHVFLVDERYIVSVMTEKDAVTSGAADPLRGLEAARRWAYTALTRTRGGITVIQSKKVKA